MWKMALKVGRLVPYNNKGCVLSERNDEVSSDVGQHQQQQQPEHCDQEPQTKAVQITLQSAESSHKKRFFSCHVFSCIVV